MLVFATRLPYNDVQKSVKMRDHPTTTVGRRTGTHDGTRALTESGQQVAAKVRAYRCVLRGVNLLGRIYESQLRYKPEGNRVDSRVFPYHSGLTCCGNKLHAMKSRPACIM